MFYDHGVLYGFSREPNNNILIKYHYIILYATSGNILSVSEWPKICLQVLTMAL